MEMKFFNRPSAWSHLTPAAWDALCNGLVGSVELLRGLILPSQTQVSSVLGRPNRDHRLRVYPCGPFYSISTFNTSLRGGIELSAFNERNSEVVFGFAMKARLTGNDSSIPL